MTEQEAALLLTLLAVKPAVQREIWQQLGSFARYFDEDAALHPAKLMEARSAFQRNHASYRQQLADLLARFAEDRIKPLAISEPGYPALLRQIHRPPLLLYIKGEPDVLSLPQIAIVGSRNASRSGLQLAENFAASLAASGFTITSGLALGIDGAAHSGALRTAGLGKTIAVMGTGVDVVYPRQHQKLYQQIVAQGGAIVSELPPGSQPLRQYFPQRNRIISGLSSGVLIVEAASKSGSLITARQAMEQGREVFAVPGSIHNPLSRGCHQLIREGAVLTETLTDIVSQLGGMLALKAEEAGSDCHVQMPLNDAEQLVLSKIGYDPVDFDTLVTEAGLDAAELTTHLVGLEIAGIIENLAGQYQRIR